MRGRVLGERRTAAFCFRGGQASRDGAGFGPVAARWVEVVDGGLSDHDVTLRVKWSRRPEIIEAEQAGVKLCNPRYLGRAEGIQRVLYDVGASAASGLDGRTALCEWG
jgi:hypothetical protein